MSKRDLNDVLAMNVEGAIVCLSQDEDNAEPWSIKQLPDPVDAGFDPSKCPYLNLTPDFPEPNLGVMCNRYICAYAERPNPVLICHPGCLQLTSSLFAAWQKAISKSQDKGGCLLQLWRGTNLNIAFRLSPYECVENKLMSYRNNGKGHLAKYMER